MINPESNHHKLLFDVNLRHMTISARQINSGNKPYFCYCGNKLKVEEFASMVFKENGMTVIAGDEIHFYLSIFSYNYKNHWFESNVKSWVDEAVFTEYCKLSYELIAPFQMEHRKNLTSNFIKGFNVSSGKLLSDKKLDDVMKAISAISNEDLVKILEAIS